MDNLTRHVLAPLLAPAAIVGLYYTPVELVGCANRGLMALAVVMVSLVAAIGTAILAIRAQRAGASSVWWLVSTAILVLPAALLLGPLG